jgi:hypothetical protein
MHALLRTTRWIKDSDKGFLRDKSFIALIDELHVDQTSGLMGPLY